MFQIDLLFIVSSIVIVLAVWSLHINGKLYMLHKQ
jgi:hypothetical protein